MKLKVLFALVCVFAVIAAGCGARGGYSEDSVVGVWGVGEPVFSTTEPSNDAPAYFFTFGEDGTASVTTGTFSFVGKWNYVGEKGAETDVLEDKIKLDISNMLSGTYSARVEKSGEQFTLTLTDDSKNTMKLKSAALPDVKSKVPDDFKEVDYITGRWKEKNSSDVVYTFNSDGTCEIIQTGIRIEGVYVVDEKNNTIRMTYLEQTPSTWNIPFLVKESEKGRQITFANSVFVKSQ